MLDPGRFYINESVALVTFSIKLFLPYMDACLGVAKDIARRAGRRREERMVGGAELYCGGGREGGRCREPGTGEGGRERFHKGVEVFLIHWASEEVALTCL